MLIAFFISVACFFLMDKAEDDLKVLVFLPIVYFICVFGANLIYSLKKTNYFLTIVHLLFSIQYVFLPFLILLNGSYDWSIYTNGINEYVSNAVLLQSVVLAAITFIFLFQKEETFSPRQFTRKTEKKYNKKLIKLMIIIVVLSIIFIAIYPQILYKFRLITYSNVEDYYAYLERGESVSESMPKIIYELGYWLLRIAKLLIVYMAIIIIRNKIGIKRQYLGILISLAVIGASCLITTEDKAATIFSAIACMLLVAKLYSRKTATILKIGSVLAVVLIFAVFLYPIISSNSSSNVSYSINAYFSGTINVAGGFMMKSEDNLLTFLGDVLRSIPYVNHFFKELPMSYIYFNEAVGIDTVYNSEIIPMISQGYYYLGYVGAVLLPVILLTFSKKVFRKMINSKSSFEFYTYSLLLTFVLFGVYLYDFALVFSQVINYCLPILLILCVTRRKFRYEKSIDIFEREQRIA